MAEQGRYEGFIPVLEEMNQLLLKYGFEDHAEDVTRLIELATAGSEEFETEILSGDVWGGAGSLIDLVFGGNVEGPKAEVKADDTSFSWLKVRLGEEMKARGLRDESVERFVQGLRTYLERKSVSK